MNYYINPAYIDYVKKDLNELKYHIVNIRYWNEKINLLKDENEIKDLKTKIKESEQIINMMNLYFNQLDPEGKELIKFRYMNKDKKNLSFDKISKKMHYSKSKLKKIHDEAVNIIAYYKYQSIENTSDAQNENKTRTKHAQSVHTMRTKNIVL